jgi:hypothetical protein
LAREVSFARLLSHGLGRFARREIGVAQNGCEGQVFKSILSDAGRFAFAAALVLFANVALADDNFPLAGDYTQNVACKGDGTDAAVTKVKITAQEIVSNVGVCTILDTKRDGASMLLHVECKFPAGPLMGDITFTPRPDNTIEFVDRDMTYKAILHRCPN